jgi:hypothetical protein
LVACEQISQTLKGINTSIAPPQVLFELFY